MKHLWLFVLGCWWLLVPAAQAQKIVSGTVVDAATGESLPAANIQIEGTYRGTITNAEGAFELQLRSLPATLVVRYIGYETARLTVTEASPGRQDVRLQPVTYQLPEVVVSGEDPAIRIMREVIERKKVWRAALETYQAEAYNRFTISNDTGIVSIIETVTDAFWHHEQGMKETLKARRETANLDIEEALPAALFVTNLYDDDIEVGGYTLIGVTHPKALSHYDFRLEGTRYLDDQLVYDISVQPKNNRKSAFEGRVSVLDEAYALLDVELQPGEAFLFPPPIDRYDVIYRQQFSNFGRDYWLPVDFRTAIALKLSFSGLLAFPTFHVDQVSRFTDYAVNVPLPDSLYEEDDYLTVDSLAVEEGTALAEEGLAVPLSQPEEVAYASIDSTMTMEEAFAPTGLLARFVNINEDDEGNGGRRNRRSRRVLSAVDLEPELWYNRVDEVHAGLTVTVEPVSNLDLKIGGGWNSGLDGDDQWSYQGTARLEGGDRVEGFLEAGYAAGTDLRYRTDLYGRLLNGAALLFGTRDYYDYYRNERFTATAGLRLDRLETTLSAGYRDERHTSLTKSTDYDFLGRSTLRLNPPIEQGDLRSVTAALAVGDDFNPFHILGQNRLLLQVEHSTPDGLNSDFDFTRFTMLADARLPTFHRRRLVPNTLDVRLTAGTFSGDLPVQRFGTVDASLGVYRPFGALKTLGGFPYEGQEYVGFFWEHNFRTIPFEVLGLHGLARKFYNVILFGGHGRTWLSDDKRTDLGHIPHVPDGFHHEIGLSLSGLFGILRIDVAKRLDESGFAVGLAAARIF